MYLKELTIKNFRAIKKTTIDFHKGVNVLIGENNSGKTAIIDALRLTLGYRDQKNIYISKDDFYIDNEDSSVELSDIEFHLSFEMTDETLERGIFINLYNQTKNTLDLHFKYQLNEDYGFERIYPIVWGGEKEGGTIPNELLHLFYHVYLGALRDAKRFLSPGRSNKLGKLFSNIDTQNLNKEKSYDKDEMIQKIKENISKTELSDFINDVQNDYITTHFDKITFEDDNVILEINPFHENYDDFVNNFKIMLPIYSEKFENQKYLELSQNGLGYNNLIYISILLGDLIDLNKLEKKLYIGLCIEEPEAHIQPQLQNLLFSYLNDLNKDLNNGHQSFQIFITSHSPTLTAKADLESIILLQKNKNNVVNESIKNLSFTQENKDYLHKFLDVTKSQLFFSKKIIFVEGISEALLIPIFAKVLGKNLEKYGVEIINVQGLSFNHFAPLFDVGSNLIFKGSIITDKDNNKIRNKSSDPFKSIKNLENENLNVFGAEVTFEYELLNCNDENSLIWNIFRNKHHKIMVENSQIDFEDKSQRIMEILEHSIDKSDIAWQLSMQLSKKDEDNEEYDFIVPKYIENAINFLLG